MKIALNIVIMLFASCLLSAQSETATLLGESSDGKTLKLMWFLRSWDKHTTGFDIKRRTKNGAWEKLNQSIIIPEQSVGKSLQNTEPDEAERMRLKNKMQLLISQNKAKEIPAAAYLQKLSADTNALKSLSFIIALDYDLALLNGFGLIDRSTQQGNTYEYGLFMVKERPADKPSAVFQWQYGRSARLDADIIIQAKQAARPKAIQLLWQTKEQELQEAHAAGFNVYRQAGSGWKKLNNGPVTSDNAMQFTFFDTEAKTDDNILYAVALQSIFGNEGRKVEYAYNPLEHPLSYKATQVDSVKAMGQNFDKGFDIQWSFSKEDEKFINGFIVEKANLPGGFRAVSTMLAASERSFVENTFSPPATYVQFRVVAIYKDNEKAVGAEKLVYYLPVIYAPKPTNVQGKWVKEKDKFFIDLSWDAKALNDTLTTGYNLFASNPMDNKIYLEASIPLIKANKYRYEVYNNKSAIYKFSIAPVSKYKAVGNFSDTINVVAPSTLLPIPVINPYSQDTGHVALQWKYERLPDLKGFRVFQNGNMVANEFELQKDARAFVTPLLKFGDTYLFTIQAVSQNGIESPLSMARDIYIFTKGKN